MFIIKLNNNSTFTATGVMESLGRKNTSLFNRKVLTIENTSVVNDLDYYRRLLLADGALDKIEVLSDDGETIMSTMIGYDEIEVLELRVMPSGTMYLNLVLTSSTEINQE